MAYNRVGWLDAALREVRWKPDRAEIRRELEDHLADKEEHILSRGSTPEEAARLAVEAMGDPVEVGRALNRAHRPLWGVLLTGARVLAVCLLLAVLFAAAGWRFPFARVFGMGPVDTGRLLAQSENILAHYKADRTQRSLRGYTVSVEDAVLTQNPGRGFDLTAVVRVYCPWPWAEPPWFMGYLQGSRSLSVSLIISPRGDAWSNPFDNPGDWMDHWREARSFGAWYFYVDTHLETPEESFTITCLTDRDFSLTLTPEVTP